MSDLVKLLFTTFAHCALLTSPSLIAQETPADIASDTNAEKPTIDELMVKLAEIESSYLPFHIDFSEHQNWKFGPFTEQTKTGENEPNPNEYRAQRGHKDSEIWMLESTVENSGVFRTERLVHAASGLHRKETSPEPLTDDFDDGREPQIRPLEGVFPLTFDAKSPVLISEYFDTAPDQFRLQWHGNLARVTCHYHPTTGEGITVELWLDPHFSWHPVFMRRYLHDAREPFPDQWKVTEFRVLQENVRVSVGEFMGPIRRRHATKDQRIVFLRSRFQILKSAYQNRVSDAVFSPETPIGGSTIQDLEPVGGKQVLVTSYQQAEKAGVSLFPAEESGEEAREAMETPAVLSPDNVQLKTFNLQKLRNTETGDNASSSASLALELPGSSADADSFRVWAEALSALHQQITVHEAGTSNPDPMMFEAQITLKPDVPFDVLEKLVVDLLGFGIRRARLDRPIDSQNMILIIAPADASWRFVHEMETYLAKLDNFNFDIRVQPNNAQVVSTGAPDESTHHIPIAPQSPEPDVVIDDAEISDRLIPLIIELKYLKSKLGNSHPKVVSLEKKVAALKNFAKQNAKRSSAVPSPATQQHKIFNLQYNTARDAARVMKQLYGGPAFAIEINEQTNSLIVLCDESKMQEIETVIQRLDAKSGSIPSPFTESYASGPVEQSTITIAEYRRRLDALEQPVQQLAEQVRATEENLGKEHADSAKQRAELRALVQKTFAARQEIQRAELAEFTRRLQRMQQAIETRERIEEKIVDRRMEELLNPDASWEQNLQSSQQANETTSVSEFDPFSPTRNRSHLLPTIDAILIDIEKLQTRTPLKLLLQFKDEPLLQISDDIHKSFKHLREMVEGNQPPESVKESFAASAQNSKAYISNFRRFKNQGMLDVLRDIEDGISALKPLIETYQRAGVITAIDATKKQVEISLGLNDDVRIGQRLGVASGRENIGTVEVISVERDNCVARIIEAYLGRTIQKGDKIHILTDPTTPESEFPPAPKPQVKVVGDLVFESAAASDQTSPPESDAEKAIARMVLVFFQDEARRAVPGLMIDHGNETLVLTTGPATIVPDGVGHAIDRTFLEIPDASDVAVEFIDTKTADVFVQRAKPGLTKFQLAEPVDLAIGDSLSAIVLSGQPNLRVTPNAARISALNQETTFSLATHKFRHEFSGLVQIDKRLPEGTPLFKDGHLAGITLLGTRFMKEDVPGSYVVPASRIVEVLRTMKTE